MLLNALSRPTSYTYGVPLEWRGDVRTATEETLFALADHLLAESSEALLELATGGKPCGQTHERRRVLPNAKTHRRARHGLASGFFMAPDGST